MNAGRPEKKFFQQRGVGCSKTRGLLLPVRHRQEGSEGLPPGYLLLWERPWQSSTSTRRSHVLPRRSLGRNTVATVAMFPSQASARTRLRASERISVLHTDYSHLRASAARPGSWTSLPKNTTRSWP